MTLEQLGPASSHVFPVACCAMGWLAHLWQASREISAAKQERVWPHQFIARRPMRCATSLFGAFAGYLALIEFDALSPLAAFAVGLLSEMILDNVRAIGAQRLGVTQERPAVNLSDTTVIRRDG